MKVLLLLLSGVIAYLCGGANGALITTRLLYHTDIRKHGSGNAGLTNYYRTFGGPGVFLVIAIDIFKSVFAVEIGGLLMGIYGYATVGKLFAGFCLIIGHMYPVYYHFKGGKGVLCGVIMATLVSWRVGLGCFSIFVVVVALTRYVSLGSILGSLACGPLLFLFGFLIGECFLGLLCSLLIVLKHEGNIRRLIAGKERRLHFGGK